MTQRLRFGCVLLTTYDFHSLESEFKDFTADSIRFLFRRAIVGAPEAETPQVGVHRGGAVYKCDIAADDRCTLIHFDSKGKKN